MDIYLIRHGECYRPSPQYYDSEINTMNAPLTPLGLQQAELTALRCWSLNFDYLLSSDLLRALQTTEILLTKQSCKYGFTTALREIDIGGLTLGSWDDYPEYHARWLLHQEDLPYPNGENGKDLWNRCLPELEKILQGSYQKVAVVCHGGTIKSIICGLLGLPQEKRFLFGSSLENCSISIIRVKEDGSSYLQLFNDTSHL